MIGITRRAATELRSILSASRAQPGHALRLAPDGKGGIRMQVGPASDHDVVIEDQTGPVLLIGAELARRLQGLVFDWLITEVQGSPRASLSFRLRLDEETDLLPPPEKAPVASVQGEAT